MEKTSNKIVAKIQREHPGWFDDVNGIERRDVVLMQMPTRAAHNRA